MIHTAVDARKDSVPANRYLAAAQFRTALRQFLRKSEDAARAAGLTPRQHMLLLQIGAAPDEVMTVSSLVDKLALTQSTVTELVQRAEHAGLIRRTTSDKDARVVHLSLTEDGAKKLAQAHGALGPERTELRRLIDRL